MILENIYCHEALGKLESPEQRCSGGCERYCPAEVPECQRRADSAYTVSSAKNWDACGLEFRLRLMSACSASIRLYHTANPTVRMLLPFAFHVIRNFFATSMYTIFVTNLRRSGSYMQSPTAYAVWKYPV